MSPLNPRIRSLVLAAVTATAVTLPHPAAADDRIYFHNDSRRPARVVQLSQKGKFKAQAFFAPGASGRLRSGEGKSLVVINGRTFQVRDIAFRTREDDWVIEWGGY